MKVGDLVGIIGAVGIYKVEELQDFNLVQIRSIFSPYETELIETERLQVIQTGLKSLNGIRRTTLPLDSNERKEYPLYRGLLRYFPAALAGVARVSKIGNDKHNPGEPLHHARGKSSDHADCIIRHLTDLSEDFGKGVGRDENGTPQVLYAAWRALALAQEWLEQNEGAPMAPGAKP